MILQYVKLKSGLTPEQIEVVAREREPLFQALPGLVQKYYVSRGGEGEIGGVYVWDSRESMEAFRASELAKTIAASYEVLEPPVIETAEVLFALRE